MYLTQDEERIFDGELGWANQTCMRILVRLGELFGAERLIPISWAHVSGVSYKTLGDAPTEFLKALADTKAKVNVETTLNPQSFDPEYLGKKLPANLREKQSNILQQYKRMNVSQSLTCTPYYLRTLRKGSHVAWAESSAVVYANSVLNAWTNREGGPSALAAAIIGKTPDYGIHKAENRQPNITINLETELCDETEFGALGICLGKILKDKIPTVHGVRNASSDQLKQFAAALATTGMTNMFHIHNSDNGKETEKISIEIKDIRNTVDSLSTAGNVKPDLVFLGCPHCSLKEMKCIATQIGNRKVKTGTEFWICTSKHVKEKAKKHVETIEKSGGHVLAGVCTVVSWTEKLGIKTIMTNSAKTAYYAPNLSKAQTTLAPLKQCLNTALEG